MSNSPETAARPAVPSNGWFTPFDSDGILCVQDGAITTSPDEDREWTEYHIENVTGQIWRIERSDAAELCATVYQGRIPHRGFFVALMDNMEVPLPAGWVNSPS